MARQFIQQPASDINFAFPVCSSVLQNKECNISGSSKGYEGGI